jgi:hypothetical protein
VAKKINFARKAKKGSKGRKTPNTSFDFGANVGRGRRRGGHGGGS